MFSRWSKFCMIAVAIFLLGAAPGDQQSKRPPRIEPPKVDPAAAAKKAMEKYDANKDGKISGAELDKSPALKSAIEIIDTNKNKTISADEIAARIKAWQETKIGLIGSVNCTVIRDGKPLKDAIVKFVPEKFLGENFKTCKGITAKDGMASISKTLQNPNDVPGVAPGWYSVEITKSGEEIPAKYNKHTIFGLEIAPDAPPQRPLIFEIK
jgi:hypothetical protein